MIGAGEKYEQGLGSARYVSKLKCSLLSQGHDGVYVIYSTPIPNASLSRKGIYRIDYTKNNPRPNANNA